MSLSRKWKIGVPIAIAFLAAGSAAAFFLSNRREVTTTSEEAYQHYRTGKENNQKMYYKEAMADYAEALGHDPNFAMAGLRLASLLWERDPDRAKTLLKNVTRCKEGLSERERYSIELFEARVMKKDEAEIGRLINAFIKRFPGDPEGYLEKCNFLMKSGQSGDAIAEYERLLAVNPNYAIAYNSLGYHWMGRGDFVKAEDYLKRYRFLAPDQANPFDSLGEMYANIGRYEEAEENLKKALEIKPDFFASIAHLGTLEVGRGHFEAAASRFLAAAEATDVPSMQHDFMLYGAICLIHARKFPQALDALAEIEKRIPATPEAYRPKAIRGVGALHAMILFETGEPSKAMELLDRLPQDPKPHKGPGNDAPSLVRGMCESIEFLKKGDLSKEREFVKTGLPPVTATGGNGFSYYPGQMTLRVRLASEALADGFPEEARALIEPILALNPRFQMALDLKQKLDGKPPETSRKVGS